MICGNVIMVRARAQEAVQVEVLHDPRCIDLMTRFIRERPDLWDEDIGVPPDA